MFDRRMVRVAMLVVGLAGTGLAVIGLLIPPLNLAFTTIGSAIAAVTLIYQYRTTSATVITVSDSDWLDSLDGGSRQVTISPSAHGRGTHPNVTVWECAPDGSFEEVMTDIHTLVDGTVVLRIGRTVHLDGQVRIA